jgi:hypothetical protein
VEFKANKPGKEFIRKDIEKLVREKIMGNWIHTIEKISDNNYINSLFNEFIWSFNECKNTKYLVHLNKGMNKVDCISIVFYFYSIREKWACMKHFYFRDFSYDGNEVDFMKYVNEFFFIDYKVNKDFNNDTNKSNYFIETLNSNGWFILSLGGYHNTIY